MYKITVQNLSGSETTIYYPGNKDYTVISAVLTYDVGLAGEFNFTVPSTNPAYDLIVRNAIVTVYEDNKEIWRGDIRDIKTNFDKSISVYAVEDLAWLGEEPAAMVSVTDQTYSQRFTAALTTYNANQVTKRQFAVGQLTAQSSSSVCTWQPEYGDSILSGLRKFIAKENGYLKVRRAYTGNTLTRYIDIVTLADYGKQSTQKVEFGSNLIDFIKDMDVTNLCNALYPYGAETETELYGEIMQRIAGTPIQNNDSITAYGRRAKTVVFDTEDVTTLNNLASAYLSRYSQPALTLQIKAADLGSITNVDTFAAGDSVRVVASVYAVDQWMYITKMDVNLLDAAQNQITLSDTVRNISLTSQVTSQAEEIKDLPSPLTVLEAAKQNALKILEGEDGGIITFVVNSDGQLIEQRILNNLDIDQATKAWRWTLNGLAYLHREYPSDAWIPGIAMTMDGSIVADFITTGSLTAGVMQTNVISAINGQNLKIEAKNIDITGAVTFNDFTTAVQNTINGKADSSALADYATLSSLQTGTTVINGGCITTGNIKSGNYSETSAASEFSTSGTKIDLDNGLIKSKNFRISNDGGAFGILKIDTGTAPNYDDASIYAGTYKQYIYEAEYPVRTKQGYSEVFYINPYMQGFTEDTALGVFFGVDAYYPEDYTPTAADLNQSVAVIYLDKRTSLSDGYSQIGSVSIKLSEQGVGKKILDNYGHTLELDHTFGQNPGESYRVRAYFDSRINSGSTIYRSYIDKATFAIHNVEFMAGVKVSLQEVIGNFKGGLVGSADLYSLKCGNVESDGDGLTVNSGSGSGNGIKVYNGSNDIQIYTTSVDANIVKHTSTVTYVPQWSQVSDRRLKDNIEPLNMELSKALIDGSEPIRFNYIEEDGKHYGMIAQDVRKQLDRLGEKDAQLEFIMNIPKDMQKIPDQRAICYEEYIPHLINYVKDLRSEITSLKHEIKLLKEEKHG